MHTRIPHNTQRLERDIVTALLEALRDLPADYPPVLKENRKIVFISQIDETKKTSRTAMRPAGS